MKLHRVIIIALSALLLTACNFTLAADITPPPDYIPPTPMPTLGPLYPSNPSNVQNGAAIYKEHCAACHGDKGLGDGPQSMQLGVAIPAFGLPEIARPASPAEWFKVVSQGNLQRFMPPFVGALSEQQRWDVVSYVLTLHTTPDELSQGKSLFEANCADCASKFSSQEKMAALSEADLVRAIKNGDADIPAFGKNFTDDQAFAVAEYLRTLTFAATVPVTPTPLAEAVSTPSAGGTSGAAAGPTSSAEAMPVSGTGTVSGTVEIASGSLPANLSVTLHGYDHGQNQTSGPQETLTLTTTVYSDGSYNFENVEMPENRIFLAEVKYAGIAYRSDFDTATAGATNLALPPVKLYEPSNDINLLRLDQIHIYTDFATAGSAQFLEIYAFSNPSDKAVLISTDGSTIPFIPVPEGAQSTGYEAGQDSAPFINADNGVAVVPSDKPYSIIAFFTLPYDKKLEIKQPFAIDAQSVVLLIPDGMKMEGKQLTDRGIQAIQNNNYHMFSGGSFKAGDKLTFTISGKPKTTSATGIDTRQGLLIGAGALGLMLIVAGVWLFVRDRRRAEGEDEEGEFESADEVMDAILALDDLHRAGKISEPAYQKRRTELKEILKEMA
jgi:mono/diheme cytochrome c family protein